jgi:hypothetical protein
MKRVLDLPFDLSSIKPTKSRVSDFYSWNLYVWLKSFPECTQIYVSPWNPVSGFEKGRETIFIGLMDEHDGFHGIPLKRLCSGAPATFSQRGFYGENFKVSEWKEITESFWTDYLQSGVCAIHGDFAHKWDVKGGDFRQCLYCKVEQHRAIELIPRDVWSNKRDKVNPQLGAIVKLKNGGPFASGCARYDDAIVVREHPLRLVTRCGNMRYNQVKVEDVEQISLAGIELFNHCLERSLR